MGDIHQPLHNATLYNSEFPEGDRGGNRFKLHFANKVVSLHGVWDSAGGRFVDPIPSYRLDSYITWFQEDHPIESLAEKVSVLNVDKWSDEGFALSRSLVYTYLEPGGLLDNESLQEILDASKLQITLAGYRLAKVLDQSLD